MKRCNYLLFYVLLVALVFSGCYDEEAKDPKAPQSWQPEISVPVGILDLGKHFELYIKDYNFPEIPDSLIDSVDVLYDDTLYIVAKNDLNLDNFIPFDLETFSEDVEENIKYVIFKTNIINGFPTSMKFAVRLLDDSKSLLSTLVDEEIKAGTVINDSVTDVNEVPPIIVTYKDNALQEILGVSEIEIVSEMVITMEMLDKLRLYSEYVLQLQIAVTVGFDIDLSEKIE